jgi:solute carrier family 45 protein 3
VCWGRLGKTDKSYIFLPYNSTTIEFICIIISIEFNHTFSILQVFFYDVRPHGYLPAHGIATSMASLDSAYFLSQVMLSMSMGYVVHMSGTVLSYVICAGSMGAVACACITRVVHNKQQVTALLRTTRTV